MTLDSLFTNTATRLSEKVAVTWQDREYTFGQLEGASNRIAQALLRLGIAKGERVCIFMQNAPEFIMAHFGILKAGAVVVPLNVMYRQHELRYMINDSEAAAIIVSEANIQHVLDVRSELRSVRLIVVIAESVPAGCYSFYDLISREDGSRPKAENEEGDIAVICYTSGTTGISK
ncbi:MAG TPA: AMP-binding protein, partial [Candidatus Methanomethylicus sp.]|nr:AMP-binding protein [Candidatus Methanomethylicus sp.]